eukprot:3216667-Pleurochrysis_carterae.AAC.2
MSRRRARRRRPRALCRLLEFLDLMPAQVDYLDLGELLLGVARRPASRASCLNVFGLSAALEDVIVHCGLDLG